MAKTRRKKRRTQGPASEAPGAAKIPKSFVFARKKLGGSVRQLELDIRKVMMPHTAINLKVKDRNSLKDFVHVAGPLGVTHFVMLSKTDEAPYLRVARTPRGPTLTFKVHSYSLCRDVHAAQSRPRAPPNIFRTPPLVVMNNFSGGEDHLKLITIMFQNMFPAINVNKVKLSECQRVLLLNYNRETKHIDVRHYSVAAQPSGVSRSIRKLVQRRIPNLAGLADVSEFVTRSGYGSESEAEDEASKVTLAQRYTGKGNLAAHQSAVKLHEVGPRLSMQLVKVEEGLCDGAVMFHEYVQKTAEEVAELQRRVEAREALKQQRKAQQEANVKRKQRLANGGHPLGGDEDAEAEERGDELGGVPEPNEEEEDDDAEWYRKEVGEEPDEGFGARPQGRRPGKEALPFLNRRRKKEGGADRARGGVGFDGGAKDRKRPFGGRRDAKGGGDSRGPKRQKRGGRAG